MPRYVAFLRGVSPTNLQMADLRRCLEDTGFTRVKTVLASGNAVFDATSRSPAAVERQVEAALERKVGRTFHTIVRSVAALEKLLARDPYADFELSGDAKRVVTFARRLHAPETPLPIVRDNAQLLAVTGTEAFSVYVPGPQGPVFMALLEKTFGKEITTRTWDTVRKCAAA